MADSPQALYLYCITPEMAGFPAIESVFTRRFGSFSAVLSEVPVDDYLGEAAEARLQDLSWVGPRACRHDQVIEEFMRRGPVLPLRFATLFSSLEKIEQMICSNEQAIRNFFAALGDKREWAVKGVLERGVARSQRRAAATPEGGSPGKHYLQMRRSEAEIDRQLNQTLKEICRQAAADLQPLAAAFSERKVLKLALDSSLEVILNWAFLLPEGAEPDFRSRVDDLTASQSATGLRFVLTGPWAPYSFAPSLSTSP